MIDNVHTNRERIDKIRSVFEAVEYMLEHHADNPVAALHSLNEAAKEAEGCLQAVELTLLGETR